MKTFLVTGSAGFIGYHTCKRLLDEGHVVYGIDNLNDYYDVELKIKRHKLLKGYKNYFFWHMDISIFPELKARFELKRIDTIIHLAAQAGVRGSFLFPEKYIESNVTGTLNIFRLAVFCNIKNVIYASSSSVYGNNIDQRESTEYLEPVSYYGLTKKMTEQTAALFNKTSQVRSIGLRFFTVYGEFGRPDMAIWKFTRMIDRGISIDIFGDCKRAYTHVDDAVDGIILSINKIKNLSFGENEIYNIGSDKQYQTLQIAHVIADQLQKPLIHKKVEYQFGDVFETLPNLMKSKRELGFSPSIDIIDGIGRFVNWYKENGEVE